MQRCCTAFTKKKNSHAASVRTAVHTVLFMAIDWNSLSRSESVSFILVFEWKTTFRRNKISIWEMKLSSSTGFFFMSWSFPKNIYFRRDAMNIEPYFSNIKSHRVGVVVIKKNPIFLLAKSGDTLLLVFFLSNSRCVSFVCESKWCNIQLNITFFRLRSHCFILSESALQRFYVPQKYIIHVIENKIRNTFWGIFVSCVLLQLFRWYDALYVAWVFVPILSVRYVRSWISINFSSIFFLGLNKSNRKSREWQREANFFLFFSLFVAE